MMEETTNHLESLTEEETSTNGTETNHAPEDLHPSFNIVPDPNYYVVRPDDIYSKLKRMIETSRGGVIGLTGVRGAGKSVLLRKVEQEFSKKHYTLQITAPTSSSQETAFFVMLYRRLCDSIFSAINEKVFGKRFDALNIGQRESWRRELRFKIVLGAAVIIFVGMCFLGFHAFSFYSEKNRIKVFSVNLSKQHQEFVHQLRTEIDKQKIRLTVLRKDEEGKMATLAEMSNNMKLQLDRAEQSMEGLKIIFGLQKQAEKDLLPYISNMGFIPHPAVIAYYNIFSKGGFDYRRNFLEPRELLKEFNSIISKNISSDKLLNIIKSFTGKIRDKTTGLENTASWPALLTTITDGGRAEFTMVEKLISEEQVRLEKQKKSLKEQEIAAKAQLENGKTNNIDAIENKYDALLAKIPEKGQQVTNAFNRLKSDIDSFEFKPLSGSTWTNLRLPHEQIQESVPGKTGMAKTINDSITDSVNEMAKFFQFFEANVEKELVVRYDNMFKEANEFLANFRNPTDTYREVRGYVPYLMLGLIVVLMIGALISLVLVTWRRAKEARRHKHALGLIRTTEGVIRMLDYHVTRSRSAQVQVPLLQRIMGSFSVSEQEQERSLTLPGLTAHYIKHIREVQDVLEQVYNSRKLIICIDELDKINDPEQVGNVLREIKGALYLEDCFYLLSISEDAVKAFESRFIEERDIFESTFDEIMFIERLDLPTCEKVALRRLEEIGYNIEESENCNHVAEAIRLASVVSTGVPREFLRNMRVIVTESHGLKKLNATSSWYALFQRNLLETLEKIRAACGLEELRAELIEDIERLNKLTAATIREAQDSSILTGNFNKSTTCDEISNLEKRLSEFAEITGDLGKKWEREMSDERRGKLQAQLELVDTWQRNWLELLIYLYLRKACLIKSGTTEFTNACKELLDIYAMLPYSFARSKKLLLDHMDPTPVE